MRIQFHHQFYAGPEAPGPAQPRRLVQRLAEAGHQVDVLACNFNVYSEATEKPEESRNQSGGWYRVHRINAPRNLRANLTSRLRTYGYFAVSSFLYGCRLARPDLVIASIQPLFSGYSAYRVARWCNCPFVLEVRDLWPDALVVRRALAPWQALPLEKMARVLYTNADRVVSVTPGIKTELVKKGVASDKVDVIPNSYDESLFAQVQTTRDRIRAEYGWGDSFVAIYTGTHTDVTAVDVIVRAAQALRSHPNVRFDLFGSGQAKSSAIGLARRLDLQNIFFHDPVPKSAVPKIVAAADIGIMTLFKSPLIHIYFENKLIDYMGSGKPIAAAIDGIQGAIIEAAGAGRVVPSLDHDGLAGLVAEAEKNRLLWSRMGQSGRRYVSTRLAQSTVLAQYISMIEAIERGDGQELRVFDPFQR